MELLSCSLDCTCVMHADKGLGPCASTVTLVPFNPCSKKVGLHYGKGGLRLQMKKTHLWGKLGYGNKMIIPFLFF